MTNTEPDVLNTQRFSGGALVLSSSATRQSITIVFTDKEMLAAQMMIELEQRKRPGESMQQLFAHFNGALLAAIKKADPNILYVKILAAATVAAIAILEKDPALKCVMASTDHACAPPDTQIGTYATFDYADPFQFLDDLCADLGGTYGKIG